MPSLNDKDIFQCRLGEGDGLDLSGERFHQPRNKTVAVSLFDAHFVIQNCRFYAELLRNPCSERISILCFRADHVATDFGPKRGRGIQADDLAPIDDGNAIAVILLPPSGASSAGR